MSRIMRFDHVGVTVQDLDQVTASSAEHGLEIEGRTFVEGKFIDTVRATLIPVQRSLRREHQTEEQGWSSPASSGQTLSWTPRRHGRRIGRRRRSFEVDDLQAHVDRLAAEGYGLVGGIGL